MNYKRFSRFFCLAAACCVILAGAAAPLTAYAAEDDGSAALDVAQETRTLSGTWTFNDVLIVPEWLDSYYDVELDFSVSSGFVFTDDSIELTSVPFVGQSFWLVIDESGFLNLSFRGSSSSSVALPYVSESDIYWNAMHWLAFENFDLDIPALKGWGQTITFTEEQEVPVEFYDWFTANAVKQVSSMEAFLDNFTAPISGIWSVVTDVSDTIVSTPLLLLAFCFAFLGLCVSIFGRILSRS